MGSVQPGTPSQVYTRPQNKHISSFFWMALASIGSGSTIRISREQRVGLVGYGATDPEMNTRIGWTMSHLEPMKQKIACAFARARVESGETRIATSRKRRCADW